MERRQLQGGGWNVRQEASKEGGKENCEVSKEASQKGDRHMSDRQPPPVINVQYITQEAKKSGWPLWFVAICLFFAIAACGQCGRWMI